MDSKYQHLIDEINKAVANFSTFLADGHKVKPIAPEHFDDPYLSWNLAEIDYADHQFPGHSSLGVYFLLGKSETDPDKLGLYVGKASLAGFGHRLWKHLNQPRMKVREYPKGDANGTVFLLEQIVIITMDETPFIAPALEQFLIAELSKDGVHLINKIGKS
jgi:hypothetical protein